MYCLSNHVISTTAGVAVLLVISLIVFWITEDVSTDVHNGEEFTSLNNSILGSVTYQFVEGEKEHINNGVTQQYRLSSTLPADQHKVSDRQDGAVAKGSKDSNDSTHTIIDDILLAKHSDKIEYVTPLKTSKNQYEDPPDGQSMTKRHYSGNFRQPTASVWDPHPQYEFTAFGREFRLRLKHDSSFLSPDVKVTHIRNNETTREEANHQLGCFYSGYLDGDSKSDVSVSLCNGMTGHVRTSSDSYIIKPAEYWKDEKGRTLKHVFYRESKTRSNGSSVSGPDIQPRRNGCGVIDYDIEDEVPVPLIDDSSAGEMYVGDRHRERRSSTTKIFWDNSIQSELMKNRLDKFIWHKDRRLHSIHENTNTRDTQLGKLDNRRADQLTTTMDPFSGWRSRRAVSQKYFIEIMVVADKKMVEYHGSELLSYILVLMSTVYRIYKDPSIGNPISIAVTKIVQVDQSFGLQHNETNGISAAEMLKSFCKWQKLNNPNEPSPEHHDAALLLTREILCRDPGQKRCETLGLAKLGGMCSLESSCAIVQDNGLQTAFTMAHEIGHVLNMLHDDDPKCKKFQVSSDIHNFMTRRLDDSSFRWEWSKCSRHYITEFLENANCLLDEPNNVFITPDAIRLPGEYYSGNNQCELVFGRGSKICTHRVDDVCKRLWCITADDVDCRTLNMPWADGTPCGNDQSELKWCHRGECVSVETLEPIHGQWGEWGEYGDCSRTCGGGIQKRYRECNGPSPQHGGDYCIGERVEDRSCASNECSLDALDFREEQCSKFNNNSMKIPGLDNNTEWHAKYTRLNPEDRCKLFCQVESKQYYMLRGKVIDGTPCGPDTFDICVHGHCKPAGCDHILNSTAKLDTCGVCRGDNSTCQKITGSHNSSHYGYTRVIKIPAGSSNIDIKQYGGSSTQNDSNYLALRLEEGGEYILNGNYTIMHRKVIIHPGITIEYSGPDTHIERLNTSRTINVNIILEVLSVEKVLPQIVYEYTVPKNILKNYKWSLSDWSQCNYVCQGMKYRRAQCQNTEFKETVSDDYCTPEEKPQEEKQTCNSYCTLEWQVAEASECSNYCGPGNRTISTQCVQTLKNQEGQPSEPVAIHACWHIERPSNYEPCVGPCNSAHWSYGKWGTCSVTCGDGIQSRIATCVDTSDKVIAETKCIPEEKIVTRICGDKICPKWSLGKWSACSVTCGIGERIRSIWCQIENRIVDTRLCTNSTLDVRETCDAGPCYRWDTSHFKNCDIECGEKRLRMIRCKDMEGNVVPDVHCSPQKKPKQLKKCHREACATSITANETPSLRDGGKRRWRVSNWTPCSKHCGVGFQERVVTCRRVNRFGWVDPLPIDGCLRDKRPNKKRTCKLRECNDEYYWATGKWRKCSHSCGRKGKQTRRLFCVNANGDKHARSSCPSKFKPNRERKCNQRRCGPRTCLEAQKRYKPMNDGEYTLLIGGKSMKIFCLDAATNAPREYLTLPAGDRKNYAEIYNKSRSTMNAAVRVSR